jgi:hypothetical protein
MTRTITPHKGGRTAQLHVLCTPATKARLVAIADQLGITQGDLIERWVNAWWAEPVRELPDPPAKEEGRTTDNDPDKNPYTLVR